MTAHDRWRACVAALGHPRAPRLTRLWHRLRRDAGSGLPLPTTQVFAGDRVTLVWSTATRTMDLDVYDAGGVAWRWRESGWDPSPDVADGEGADVPDEIVRLLGAMYRPGGKVETDEAVWITAMVVKDEEIGDLFPPGSGGGVVARRRRRRRSQ